MNTAMKNITLSLATILVVSAAAIGAASAEETITLGTVGSGSALNWPLLVALDKGFFEKNNVKIDLVSAPSSAAVQQQVAAGSVDMGSGGLVDPIRAIDKGAAISIIRIEAKAAPYALYVKPEIADYAALKGKTIMVGGAKDITRIYLERMAAPNGLNKGDYDLIYAGATSARFAALQSGAVDGALISAPFNFQAETAGMKNLGVTVDYVKDFPFTGYAVNVDWAKDHKPAIQGFLTGYSQAVTWLADPANRDEAVNVLIKDISAKPDDAQKTYDFFKSLDIYDPEGTVDKAGLGKLLDIMKGLGDLEGSADPDRFYNATILAKD